MDNSLGIHKKGTRWTIEQVKLMTMEISESKLLSDSMVNMNSKLDFQCKCGNTFTTRWSSFLSANVRQCSVCSGFMKWNIQTIKDYLNTSKGNGCSLISTEYSNMHSELEFQCKCGEYFSTTLHGFIYRKQKSCNDCAIRRKWSTTRIKKFIEKEGNGCTLLSTEYIRALDVLDFRCSCGREFSTTWSKFYSRGKRRCNVCSKYVSNGELRIMNVLDNLDVNYEEEYSFEDCTNKERLRFDFAVLTGQKVKFLIEYDGQQHFELVSFGGSEEENIKQFKLTQKRDKIKNKYCEDNNISLLRIPYWDFDNIEYILTKWLQNNEVVSLQSKKQAS